MANSFYGSYSFLDVDTKFILPTGADPAFYNLTAVELPGDPPTLTISGSEAVGVAQEGITVAAAETRNIMSFGADRSVMHNLIATKPATCTIRLLRVSPVNLIFAKLYELQTTSARLHGYNQIKIFVNNEQCLTLKGVAFQNPPETLFAREMSILEWVFDVADLEVLYNEMAVLEYQEP